MNISNSRQKTLGGAGQHVLDYLRRMQAENPAFFFAIQDENEHSSGNVLWVDAASRLNYNYFGDTVRLDTFHRRNQYGVPFSSFTGLNHHGQPVLFGCALVFNESAASFIWLLQTWLQAMSGNHPVSITTEADKLIQMAVAQVFPQTHHRFCRWNIFRGTQEKLAHIYQMHPTFEIEYKNCVNEAETVDEFESRWESLLQRYYLMDNEWLQSIYNTRHQWVPVYMKNTFFGEINAVEENDPMNSYFDEFLNASTTTQLFIKQYEQAVTVWHEKEVKADFDSVNSTPILRTPSPMEKQAASLYTRRIFMKFQEELVETLANHAAKIDDSGTVMVYRVAKYGEENKPHTVRFNSFELKANCSCQMFEFSGIICRHVLSVFRAKNVLTLPSHYVLKRWTRDVKSGVAADEHVPELPGNSNESLTVRYNTLRQQAIKFVEEGAKSIQTYNVAMDALREAAKKVAAAKKRNVGATKRNTLANGCSCETYASNENQAISNSSKAEKEKKIEELTAELERTNQRWEVYRSNLMTVLRDVEDQKLKLSVKVQNARLSLKE